MVAEVYTRPDREIAMIPMHIERISLFDAWRRRGGRRNGKPVPIILPVLKSTAAHRRYDDKRRQEAHERPSVSTFHVP